MRNADVSTFSEQRNRNISETKVNSTMILYSKGHRNQFDSISHAINGTKLCNMG